MKPMFPPPQLKCIGCNAGMDDLNLTHGMIETPAPDNSGRSVVSFVCAECADRMARDSDYSHAVYARCEEAAAAGTVASIAGQSASPE